MRAMPARHLEAVENAKRALAFAFSMQETSERLFASYVSCPVCPPGSDRDCTLVGLGTYICAECGAVFSKNGIF